MAKPKVIVLRTAGTNCDKETAFAFETAGASAEFVHINELARREKDLAEYQILAIPGGFSYGDDIASGKILANELKYKIEERLQRFIRDGKLIIGICNGFQILVKAGLLPNLSGSFQAIESTLTLNDSDKFEDRWVRLKSVKGKAKSVKCVWTEGIDEVIELPVAHGEGKFIPKDKRVLHSLKEKGMIVFEYVDEEGRRAGYPHCPNGSVENIAGICDPTGRIFGLMPHPERHISRYQHPCWTRKKTKEAGDGLAIFNNGVNFAKKHL
jgi:phosphoribosylformylglycinamidine synthase subunit PurQ / glutaminase